MRWREPQDRRRTCPKCGARMKVTAVENSCVYCGFSEVKRLKMRERSEPTVLPSVRGKVLDSIATAEEGHRRPRFVSFHPPRELFAEREILWWIVAFWAAVLWIGGHWLVPGSEESLGGVFLMSAVLFGLPATALTMWLTLPTLKFVGALVAALVAFVAAALLIAAGLYGADVVLGPGLSIALPMVQLLISAWLATFFWREYRLLMEQS